MGWRAAKASGNASMPVDEGGSFAQGFASTFVPMFSEATSSFLKAKQDERMLELKESLLRQRPRSSGTAATDRADAKELREIAALATQLGITPAEAASRYAAADGNASKAAKLYTEEQASGITVQPLRDQPVVPSDPVVPSNTDDLSSTETGVNPNAPVVELSEASVGAGTPKTAVELAATEEPVEANPAFQAFEVASLGSIEEDLSLLTGTPDSVADTTASVAKKIDEDIVVADASGATPLVTNRDMLVAGATQTEVQQLVSAGTRIPAVYAIPPVAEITTLAEATAALAVLDGRAGFIGGTDQFDLDVRPMLEARIRSLTELPDLGSMLQENNVDQLREFYENGYKAYEGRTDPGQLAAHRERAGQLLGSVNAYPPIPSDLGQLREMRNRVSAGEFADAPTEWLETLNKNVRSAELQQRYGDRLTVDYIMSDERTPRELEGLREAAVFALGEESPLVRELDIALGTPVADAMPVFANTTPANWRTYAAAAERLGDTGLASDINELGATFVELESSIDIAAITSSNWPTYLAKAESNEDAEMAAIIRDLGAVYDRRKVEDSLPKLSDVRAESWESMYEDALDAGYPFLATQIEALGRGYDAAENDANLADQIDAVSGIMAKAQTNIRDTNAAVDAYLDVASSGYSLVQILRDEQDTNRVFGGQLSSLVQNLAGEVSAFTSLVGGIVGDDPEAGVSYDQGVAAIEAAERSALDTENLTDQNRAYVMFKAQEARLAFKIARLQQGPNGVISNQDYDAALGQISRSADPEIFAASLRGLIEPGRENAERLLTTLRADPQIQLAILRQEGMPIDVTAGSLRTIEERVEGTPAQESLAWINGSEAASTATPNTAIPPTIKQGAIDLLRSNPSLARQFDEKYGAGAAAQYLTEGGE